MKRGTRGMGRVYQRGGIFWIQYSVNGKKHRESVGRDEKGQPCGRPVAVKLLQKRQAEVGKGQPLEEAPKVLLSDLKARIEADYQLQQRRSGKRLGQLWDHLAGYFGKDEPVAKIGAARIEDYVSSRLAEGAARGTVKNELNALRRAFRLALKAKQLHTDDVPSFPTIKTSAPRRGFFEREAHDLVRAALPPDAGDLAEYLYWTGWRSSEAKNLRWSNVDESAGIIRIEDTKSDEPRELPYSALPQLAELIAHRRQIANTVQKERGMVVAHVFHRAGEPIRYFRRSWATACRKAGVPGRLPHDYRRSAARNLSRAGVPEGVIMRLCGWKTRSVFDRYRIVVTRDLVDGLARLAESSTAKPAKVSRMARRKA